MPEPTTQEQLVAEYELDVPNVPPNPLDVSTSPGQPRDEQGRFTAQPEVTSAEVTPSPSPTPQHEPYLVRLAEDQGIPTADINAYSPDQLRAVVREGQRSMLAERERSRRETPRDTPRPDPVNAPAKPADETDALLSQLGEFVSTEDDPERGYHPQIAALGKAVKHLLAEIKSLKGDVGGVKGYVEGQVQLTNRQQADQFFAKNEARYGKGTREDFKDGDPLLQRRIYLTKIAAENAKPGESNAASLARAERIIYEVETPAPTPEPKPTRPSREQEWDDAAVARPTNRVPAEEPKGKRRATRAVGEMLAAQNTANGSEHSELPD